MEFIEFLEDTLGLLAVTVLPVGIIWWWNALKSRERSTYIAYFWLFIIAIGLVGILRALILSGAIEY